MKIIFHGLLTPGDVGLQRMEALQRMPGLEVVPSAFSFRKLNLIADIAWRISWQARMPFDRMGENEQLLSLARTHRPDAVMVYNSRALRPSTVRQIKRETGATLVYIAPDDVMARHNNTLWLRRGLPLWDLFFTSKTFNVPELHQAKVRRPILNENIFDPAIHRPMSPAEVGAEYEKFDFAFVGTFERDRAAKLRMLASAGFSVVVYGTFAGLLHGSWKSLLNAGVEIRPGAFALDYTRAVHTAKVPLGFLRKMNRDLITHRSIELPAMGRAMLAEKTSEHDSHLVDGEEYVGFSTEEEMVDKARELIADADRRARIGQAALRRCLTSGYSVDDDMGRMVDHIRQLRSEGGAS